MTPLVLVHGFMGGSDQWRLQAPLAETRRVEAVDLPGFGLNADIPALDHIDAFAAWVMDKVTRLGIEHFDLLGHSMGGMVVQEMMRLAPERARKLVLYGTGAVGALPGRFEPIETSMNRAHQDGAQATARRISATWFLDSSDAPEYPHCATIAEQTRLPAILAGLDAMRHWSGVAHLSAIASPTLIVWGDRDRTYAWSQIEQLWHTIPETALAVIPGCAHAVHSEAPDLFNATLARFLDAPKTATSHN